MIIRALPYPDQMRDLQIASDYVEFTWRTARYRVTQSFWVDEVGDGVLIGTERAILMRRCIDAIRAADAAKDST